MSKQLEAYSKRISTFFNNSLIWLLVLLGTLIFFWEGQERFFILWGFWVLLVGIAGTALFITGVALTVKENKKTLPVFALLVLLGGMTLLVTGKGMDYGVWPRFYLAKHYYDYNLKRVLAAQTIQEAERLCNGNCRVNKDDDGKLTQIVFPLGTVGGFLGWQAFVYDPVGGVMQSAKARQGDNSVDSKYQGRIYFNCSLFSATHLTGPWYFCSFWHS